MRSRPLVSVVTAAYKTEPAYLRQALQSAVAQSCGDLEVLVSDDSPDDSLREVVAGLGDDRIIYRHRAPALGVAVNHWTCFREARGKYVAILNHDDFFAPDFLARLVLPLERDPTIGVAFCDHWVVDASGRPLEGLTEETSAKWGRSALRSGRHQPFFSLLAQKTIPMAMGAVFRRELLPSVMAEHAGPAYDLWLTYYLARDGGAAFYVSERLSSWRTHATNLTSAGGLDWGIGAATC
jgi:glycosyltransferase involved in cell wall biosynthesis